MISTDFAPNEQWDDALLSLKLLFQPWRWRNGSGINEVKKAVLEKILHVSPDKFYVSLFLTGRSALYTILKSLNLPKGSEVIVQAFTCEAVILPILQNGLKPVYIDIESNTFSIDPIDLQKKISDKTDVVILQHTFGIPPVHRTKIYDISKKHNLVLIEDIAHGYSMRKISNLKSQISNSTFLMSFGRSKALSSVFGGAIATNDIANHEAISHNQINLKPPSLFFIFRLLLYKPISVLIKATYDIFIGKIIHKIINLLKLLIPEITQKEKAGRYDFLLDKAYPNALAILLSHQLEKFDRIQSNRASICNIYRKKIQNPKSKQITNYQLPITNKISNFKFQISNLPLLRYPILTDNRDQIIQEASKRNIFLGNWYNQVVAPKSIDLTRMQYKKGDCPIAEKICKKIINLPTNITHQEVLKVIRILTTSLY